MQSGAEAQKETIPRWSEMGVFPPTWLIRDTDDYEIFRMRRNLAET